MPRRGLSVVVAGALAFALVPLLGGIAHAGSLTQIDSVPGKILDVSADRILFVDRSGPSPILMIKDRASGQTATVPNPAPNNPLSYGWLTPRGAMFELSIQGKQSQLFEWRGGAASEDRGLDEEGSAIVRASFAEWSQTLPQCCGHRRLMTEDLISGTIAPITDAAGNFRNDVTASGDVVYWTSPPDAPQQYEIFRYRNGASQQLTTDDPTKVWNYYPMSDGSSVVYGKEPPCCGPDSSSIRLYRGGKETALTPFRPTSFQSGRNYLITGGWVTFTDLDPSTRTTRIYTVSPGDVTTHVADVLGDVSLVALDGSGALMYVNEGSNTLLYKAVAGDIQTVASGRHFAFLEPTADTATDTALSVAGEWLVTEGGNLFRFDPAAEPSSTTTTTAPSTTTTTTTVSRSPASPVASPVGVSPTFTG